MPSERMQRRIESFLDQAEEASDADDWSLVATRARAVLAIDPENEDAAGFLQMAVANGVTEQAQGPPAKPRTAVSAKRPATSVEQAPEIVGEVEPATPDSDPASFAGGRYKVLRFLGEGGKKRVFLAHDALLDRDIAFSLIKTEGLDDVGRERIMREAQAMGRLTHQNIVSIYDIGEHTASDGTKQPYLVQELMGGGDVEDLLADANGPLPLRQSLDIAIATARGLEFAHTAGVIHRDIKPGNVWLTVDGIAKIGDLGLAVTLEQSRLTSHGMMVGTFGYMPPEQALGNDVTPQADLYSLGAMLYELVTGRPPFQGDTPTAVISQHLNVQPVAPSWHSDHCPPNLEALILKLLEKAPSDRPASASEVVATLEAVDPEARSTSHSDSQANPLDRLARGIFVGRDRELEQLRGSLDAALQGRGGVVMLVGEPGIGKTRTVQELETYARMRGAQVYWGRTHESAGMPAYWPWLQVGRAWAAQQDFSKASVTNAVSNPELIRLFPDIRQMVPALPEPPEPRDAESAQFLMFDAWAQFMRAQASETPWVVVLDDLHWADKPTLQMLKYVARELANMNVLVVGTYRDTDLVRTHPLSETLAELNRESGFQRTVLRGLDADEVSSYVRQRANVEPAPALLDHIYEETEGNPFFLSEIINLMTEEDTLSSDSVSDVMLPDGVREALGRRLDRLSEEANELLQVAAIVGREFAYETLDLLQDQDPDSLLGQIEEALRARVIEESDRAGRYRFTHALMQETLLGELSTTRRVRLHGQVGDALEQRWGARAEANAAQLASHYAESATLTAEHAERAIHYSSTAARGSEQSAAWDAAAQSWERVINLLEDSSDDQRLPDAMVAYGRCMRIGGVPRPGWRRLMQAREIYRALGLGREFGLATIEALAYLAASERKHSLALEALELVPDDAGDVEAELIARMIASTASLIGNEEFDRLTARCRRLLETYPNARASAWLTFATASVLNTGEVELYTERMEEARDRLAEAGEAEQATFAALGLSNTLLGRGYLDAAERQSQYTRDYAHRTRAVTPLRGALSNLMSIYSLRGWGEKFDSCVDEFATLPGNHLYMLEHQVRRLAFTGQLEQAVSELPTRDDDPQPNSIAHSIATRGRILYEAGMMSEAADELDAYRGYFPMSLVEFDSSYAELATRDEVQSAYLQLVAPVGFGTITAMLNSRAARVSFLGNPTDAVRAAFAMKLGDLAAAEEHLRDGVEWAQVEDAPVALGRFHQGLAELEERRGELDVARQHLEVAGELFSQHGANLFLDQVIAKKQILKA